MTSLLLRRVVFLQSYGPLKYANKVALSFRQQKVKVSCFLLTANGNGMLEFSEFCEIIAKNKKTLEQEEEELKNAFGLFDKNKDGTIDREELITVNASSVLFNSHR